MKHYNLKQKIINVRNEKYIIIKIERMNNVYTLIRFDNLSQNIQSELLSFIKKTTNTDIPLYLKNVCPGIMNMATSLKLSLRQLLELERKV